MQRWPLLCVGTIPKDVQVNTDGQHGKGALNLVFCHFCTGYLTDSMVRGHLGGALPFCMMTQAVTLY